jgi:hypothetical protein
MVELRRKIDVLLANKPNRNTVEYRKFKQMISRGYPDDVASLVKIAALLQVALKIPKVQERKGTPKYKKPRNKRAYHNRLNEYDKAEIKYTRQQEKKIIEKKLASYWFATLSLYQQIETAMKTTNNTKLEQNLNRIICQEVPTVLMEMLKGDGKYNNEIDATMSNPHFKTATLGLIVRNVTITKYTDGVNELFFIGEGKEMKRWVGISVMTK